MFPGEGKPQQMCAAFRAVAHVLCSDLPDRCDLSAALGENAFPLWHSHPYKTCTPPHSTAPSVHNSQLWHFLSTVFHFPSSVEIILTLIPFCLPSIPAGTPQGDSIYQPSAITCHLLTAVSEQKSKIKVKFITSNFHVHTLHCALKIRPLPSKYIDFVSDSWNAS